MTAPLAMPRADTALHSLSTIAGLRLALCEALADEHVQLTESQKTVDELTGQCDSDSILEREIAERRCIQATAAINDIEAALVRIDDGTYGRCEDCGQHIAFERLEVIPFTRQCVACSALAPRLIA